MVYLSEVSEAIRVRKPGRLSGLPALDSVNGGVPVPGATINLGMSEEHLYFDIDLALAQRAGLHLDAKPSRLARGVAK